MNHITEVVDLRLSQSEKMRILAAGRGRFVRLPIHDRIQQQMLACAQNSACGVLVGAMGTGKTLSLLTIGQRMNGLEWSTDGISLQVVVHAASSMRSPADMLRGIMGVPVATAPSARTASELRVPAVLAMAGRDVRLLCVDDAQWLRSETIGMLLTLPDVANSVGWQLGLMLAGRPEFLTSLRCLASAR
jgi:type II secretory pathway predicted ATPase ExeA